jgi:hypothetical protein
MISNQILQNTIDGLKAITRTDLCVIDVEGKILVATFPDAEQFVTPAQTFVESPADSQVVNGCQFFKVFDDHQLEYILLAYGDSEDVYMIGKIAAFQIQNLLVAYKERFDKDNFIDFDGRIEKMISLISSYCSIRFNFYIKENLKDFDVGEAYFDARIIELPTLEDVVNNFIFT